MANHILQADAMIAQTGQRGWSRMNMGPVDIGVIHGSSPEFKRMTILKAATAPLLIWRAYPVSLRR